MLKIMILKIIRTRRIMMGYKLFEMILLAASLITIASAFIKQPASVIEFEPVQEIPTVIVRIVDDNHVIHSREGMLLDGVVTVELSGK
jgi:hypothetical protein